ncbi:MAG TPA: hypothetical protein VF591_00315 [Pyrinomonadaceae bacterium]
MKSTVPFGNSSTESDASAASGAPADSLQKKASPFVEQSSQSGESGLSFVTFKASVVKPSPGVEEPCRRASFI